MAGVRGPLRFAGRTNATIIHVFDISCDAGSNASVVEVRLWCSGSRRSLCGWICRSDSGFIATLVSCWRGDVRQELASRGGSAWSYTQRRTSGTRRMHSTSTRRGCPRLAFGRWTPSGPSRSHRGPRQRTASLNPDEPAWRRPSVRARHTLLVGEPLRSCRRRRVSSKAGGR